MITRTHGSHRVVLAALSISFLHCNSIYSLDKYTIVPRDSSAENHMSQEQKNSNISLLSSKGRICSKDNWCWYYPWPHGYAITNLWASSSQELWATFTDTSQLFVLHWTETELNVLPPLKMVSYTQHSIWVTNTKDVWVGGTDRENQAIVARWNGLDWGYTQFSNSKGSILNLWASPSNDILWAVSKEGVFQWKENSAVKHNPMSNPLALWGFASNDVWVSGNKGLFQWNGNEWKQDTNTAPNSISQLSGSSSSDLWAIEQDELGRMNKIWNRRNNKWDRKFLNLDPDQSPTKIWFGSNHGWVVGSMDLLQRWDGSGFTSVPPGTKSRLLTVWGTEPNLGWIGGEHGIIIHWNGNERVPLSKHLIDVHTSIVAIHGVDSNHVWAITDQAELLYWNGVDWASTLSPTAKPLSALWARNANEVWAVSNEPMAAPSIVRWNGSTWTTVNHSIPKGVVFQSLWAPSFNDVDVWAASNQGLWNWNGTQWEHREEVPSDQRNGPFRLVTGLNSKSIWAVYYKGGSNDDGLFHWNGMKWSSKISGCPKDVFTLTTDASLEFIWAIGHATIGDTSDAGSSPTRRLYELRHGSCTAVLNSELPMSITSSSFMLSAWSPEPNQLWALGTGTENIAQWKLQNWTTNQIGNPNQIFLGLWGSNSDDMWAVGTHGMILRRTSSK